MADNVIAEHPSSLFGALPCLTRLENPIPTGAGEGTAWPLKTSR